MFGVIDYVEESYERKQMKKEKKMKYQLCTEQ